MIDSRQFRTVLGHLPTGVTVITANGKRGPVGMAANSVTSVSLTPPLVLFCAAKSSSTWPQIRDAGSFCINVMAEHHEAVARQFAARGIDRFADVPHDIRATGPALIEAVAWIGCQLDEEHEAGDHTIAVARVVAIEAASDVEPLVFFAGSYGSFRGSQQSTEP